ncbi:MAG: iron-containing alcohol dehydrogenase [Paludibacteraceae bacterium]
MIRDFSYQNPTRIHFGKSAMEKLPMELSQYGERVLLVYGKSSIKRIPCGAAGQSLYDHVLQVLRAAGKQVVELGGVSANPRYSELAEGARLARENRVDLILAVGGGSVIDCAKGISCAAYAEGDVWERYYVRQEKVDNPIIPVGSILTMAGTGSEMNSGSVITNEEQRLKIGRVYPLAQVAPRFSILNPEFTYTVPKYQMVSGIADIFSHLMEQYFSDEDDCTTDYLIEGVMRSLISASRKALQNPQDYEARSNIMWCATVALNKLLSLSKTEDWEVHMIEHQLGAYTDCAHGIGLAIISPAYYRHIYRYGLPRFVRFAQQVWGVEGPSKSPLKGDLMEVGACPINQEQIALAGIACLEAFFRELGIPSTLREVGATEAMLPQIAHSTTLGGGYKTLTADDVETILRECY